MSHRTTHRAVAVAIVGISAVAAGVSPTTAASPDGSPTRLLSASAGENTLVIYGNPSDNIWGPILEAFGEAYPDIDVETFDLGGLEAFQRYLSESSSGVATADMIIASESVGWLDLVERGDVIAFEPSAAEGLPDFAVQADGVFTMSIDPMVAMYNEMLIPPDEQPTTLAALAEIAGEIDGGIGTVEIENSQAYTANFGFVTAGGDDAWATLDALGAHTAAESGTGALLDKTVNGEYAAAFFVSGAVRQLIDNDAQGSVLDYRYLEDATPLVPRGMGIVADADSPASAQLFIEWILSAEGQDALCAGGLTPYLDGNDCPYGYQAIADQIGDENMNVVNYDPALETEREAIQSRWNDAFGR